MGRRLVTDEGMLKQTPEKTKCCDPLRKKRFDTELNILEKLPSLYHNSSKNQITRRRFVS